MQDRKLLLLLVLGEDRDLDVPSTNQTSAHYTEGSKGDSCIDRRRNAGFRASGRATNTKVIELGNVYIVRWR